MFKSQIYYGNDKAVIIGIQNQLAGIKQRIIKRFDRTAVIRRTGGGKQIPEHPDRQYIAPVSEKQILLTNGVFRKDI